MSKKKKLQTLTFDQINAFAVAYDKPFTHQKLFFYFLKPTLMALAGTYMLFINFWVALVLSAFTVLYLWRKVLPLEVKRDYNRKSFEARNNFIMATSQVLSNDDINLLDGLDVVVEEAQGEFKEELVELITRLRLENDDPHEVFQSFSSKYKVDKIFVSFVEQLETVYKCGVPNLETIENLMTMHNDLRARQEKFFEEKESYKTGFITVGALVSAFVIIPFLSLSRSDLEPTKLAQMINCIFILLLFRHLNRNFVGRYYDDSVMELRLK